MGDRESTDMEHTASPKVVSVPGSGGGGTQNGVDERRAEAVERARNTLRAFYIRARRIEAHSLLRPPHAQLLEDHANGTWTLTLTDSKAEFTTEFPDEERMESLASRARPITLNTETVYHAAVVKAVRTLCSGRLSSAESERLDELTSRFKQVDLSKPDMQAFTVQGLDVDGTYIAPVSDSSLAGGWFYLDVAHSDAKGHKADARPFSINARYTAAVPAFARLVITILDMLRFLRDLRESSVLDLGEGLDDLQVVYDAAEPREMRVFVAAEDAAPSRIGRHARAYEELSLLHVLGTDPERPVWMILLAPDETVMDQFFGVVLNHEAVDDEDRFLINIHDCLTLKLTLRGEQVTTFEANMVGKSNRQRAKGARLQAGLVAASEMVLYIKGKDVTITHPLIPDAAQSRAHMSRAEVLDDIVALDQVAKEPLELLDGAINPDERQLIRMLRRLYEGEVVQGPKWEVKVGAAEAGDAPDRFSLPAGEHMVANLSLPRPEVVAYNPRATAALVEGSEDGARAWRLTPPKGEGWFLVAPSCRDEGERFPECLVWQDQAP